MSEIRIQEVQERAQLMDKLVELLTVGKKWFSDKRLYGDLHADQGGVCDYISEREISQITFRADVLFYSVTTESMITE